MAKMIVSENIRRVVSTHGHQIILDDIIEVDTSGSWTRMKNKKGEYILINPTNVLAYIIQGEQVR